MIDIIMHYKYIIHVHASQKCEKNMQFWIKNYEYKNMIQKI